MDELHVVGDIRSAMLDRAHASSTMYNRLEGRPRTAAFDRSLRAEVRDGLWMLSRQWQLAEFRGNDAGSPVLARFQVGETPLSAFQPGTGMPRPFPTDLPLEALVEQRPVPMQAGAQPIAFDLRLLMGRRWLKSIAGIGPYEDEFMAAYGVSAPTVDAAHADVCAHPEVWQHLAAVAGHAVDGYAFYQAWRTDPTTALDPVGVQPLDRLPIEQKAEGFATWVEQLFLQPAPEDDAWEPSALEYGFGLEASSPSGTTVLTGAGYHGGHLDWFSVDIDPSRQALNSAGEEVAPAGPPPLVRTVLPAPIRFAGMPHTRWWTFEDGQTDFGSVRADTTDVGRLLVMEFGLVYANDWFLLPLTTTTGQLVEVQGLVVTNVFGERFWVDPAGAGQEDDWQRWEMFGLSKRGDGAADQRFLLMPTVMHGQEGPALEDVMLIRDEMANMVWAIEAAVPLATGRARRGSEAATETRRFHERLVEGGPASAPPAPKAPIRYRVMTSVPEHWIPFVPVHTPGSNRDVQLQRAGMLRLIEGDPGPPARVPPRTSLLRVGYEAGEPYYVYEQEVPRAGARVQLAFQRARWQGGRAVVWLGATKETGRGEGSSGLAFDQIVPTEA